MPWVTQLPVRYIGRPIAQGDGLLVWTVCTSPLGTGELTDWSGKSVSWLRQFNYGIQNQWLFKTMKCKNSNRLGFFSLPFYGTFSDFYSKVLYYSCFSATQFRNLLKKSWGKAEKISAESWNPEVRTFLHAMVLSKCRGLSPAGHKAPRSPSLTPPLRRDREEKIQQKGSWVETRTGRSLTNYGHRKNRLDFWGKINQFNLLTTKSE